MAMTVSELVASLRHAVETEVGEQIVEGEIGSCKPAASGHVYFTIKDRKAQIDCVMYRYYASLCRAPLREGVLVQVRGKATVYEGRGRLQFLATQVREAGVGELQARFLELKRKLEAEGLFDAARKRPFPRFPRAVGIVTSATGAVIADMRHVFERRAPWVKVYLLPVQVQGVGAEHGIAAALRAWSEPEKHALPAVDYVIVGRGGGSLEDLWCFNEEIVARAIAACSVPVVSAVGHETDFTIADFAADLRAPTPTAAVELCTPDGPALCAWLEETGSALGRRVERSLDYARMQLELACRGVWKTPAELLAPYEQQLDEIQQEFGDICADRLELASRELVKLEMTLRLKHPRSILAGVSTRFAQARERLREVAQRRLQQEGSRLAVLEGQIVAAGPEETLRRGYALVRTAAGRLVRDPAQVHEGDALDIRVAAGTLKATAG